MIVKKVLVEMDPFKSEVNYLKEREMEMSVQLNSRLTPKEALTPMSNEFSRKGMINDGGAILSKVSILEQEIIDVKNIYRIPVQRAKKAISGLISGDMVQMITDELNQIWSFLQRYIDEQSVDMVQEIRMPEVSLNQKMDRMDWLARNAEFMSPESIIKCLTAYKDLYNFENTNERNLYVKAIHSSEAIFTVINLINHMKMVAQDEETNSRMVILLSILEPLLVNDMNLEKALLPELKIVQTLTEIIRLP